MGCPPRTRRDSPKPRQGTQNPHGDSRAATGAQPERNVLGSESHRHVRAEQKAWQETHVGCVQSHVSPAARLPHLRAESEMEDRLSASVGDTEEGLRISHDDAPKIQLVLRQQIDVLGRDLAHEKSVQGVLVSLRERFRSPELLAQGGDAHTQLSPALQQPQPPFGRYGHESGVHVGTAAKWCSQRKELVPLRKPATVIRGMVREDAHVAVGSLRQDRIQRIGDGHVAVDDDDDPVGIEHSRIWLEEVGSRLVLRANDSDPGRFECPTLVVRETAIENDELRLVSRQAKRVEQRHCADEEPRVAKRVEAGRHDESKSRMRVGRWSRR